ncbi:MAG: hypothetical protein Q8930_07000 [Bacillota bacterium]|nr:hypothetical protein [Bacillota bacterium]
MVISVMLTSFVIIVSIFTYRNYKREDEGGLIIKLIGYYLLGAFRFNFNTTAIPLGFIIYLLFFWPYRNRHLKRRMAVLGFAIFIVGLLIPKFQEAYFERQRYVAASSSNIYKMDLERDIQAINSKLGISQDARLEDFNADFDESGEIRDLRYMLITAEDNGFTLYNISYSSEKRRYSIGASRVQQWLQYGMLIGEEQFTRMLKRLDFEKCKPEGSFAYYTIQYNGSYGSWAVKDCENFMVQDDGLKKVDNSALPVSGHIFLTYGMEKTGESSYSGGKKRAYIFP